MIKCNRGEIEIDGSESELKADLACLIYAFRESFGDKAVEECVNLSKIDLNNSEVLQGMIDDILEDMEKDARLMAVAGALNNLPEDKLKELRGKLDG